MTAYKLINLRLVNHSGCYELLVDGALKLQKVSYADAKEYAFKHIQATDTWDETELGLEIISGQKLREIRARIEQRINSRG